jgi:hypothetical protein
MNRSVLISAFPLPLFCSLYLGVQQAAACGDGNLLYEDKMQSSEDESWGWPQDPTRSIGTAGVSWKLEPNVAWTSFNQTSFYNDFEVCVDLATQYPEKSGGFLGVAFWGTDGKNNYTVDLFPADGGIGVYRRQNGKYLRPVPYFKSDAVKKEPGATNELSVITIGKHAIISVNGTKVKEFNGIPPVDGGLVGVDFSTISTDSGPSTFTYSNFQVREPPSEVVDSGASVKKQP